MMHLVSSNRIDEEAMDWVYRLAAGEASEACDAWRAVNAEHDRAFRDAWRAWQGIAETPTARSESWRDELSALKDERWYKKPFARIALPTALAASIAAAVLLLPGIQDPVAPPGQSAASTVATRIGEDRILDLDDGSKLTVGARSKLAVNLAAGDRREVILDDGQAFFEVAPDPSRPFYVLAGDAEIRVVGTKFDVRRSGGQVRVSVLEGRVEVRRRGEQGSETSPERVLTAGEQSIFDFARGGGFAPETPAAVTPGEWREGRLYYADASLGEIVADANRYSATPIRISDARVGAMRMTTSFRTGDTEGLIANVEATLALDARRAPDGSVDLVGR